MQATTQRPPLIGMNLDALTKVVLSGGMQKFVAKQLAEWLYKKKVTRFDEMVNISKKNREWLEANYVTGREAPAVASEISRRHSEISFRCGRAAMT